ncbi:dTMP kinase [Nitrospirillum viridazoti]|uniref:Thymidylate kinase n=1 Tax=Nitrospirillum viridazoti CBAmc TaxID=1441467 RepID=A0A248JW22_9PROT|nr:dTMP kinase [Nitrospirillum amazonense]ASG22779.1 dTMP kinase [Nitrospirillum amazonense CBAmc]TWB33765.1 thymidylate kinase [Nitrospirillum amazonense]
MATGRFITLEGGEGAGKSTQIRLLAQALTDRGVEVVTTREPGGGSDGAAAIRGLLVAGDTPWQRLTEALLHNAARHENVEALVRPALARSAWVLCDRYVDSTVAYQGYAMGVDRGVLADLHRLSTGGLMPDLTLVLDLPVEAGLARAGSRPGAEDRYERMGMDFHERLRQGFLDIAAHDPGRCAVIDATGDIATIQARLLAAVERRLGPLGRAA